MFTVFIYLLSTTYFIICYLFTTYIYKFEKDFTNRNIIFKLCVFTYTYILYTLFY